MSSKMMRKKQEQKVENEIEKKKNAGFIVRLAAFAVDLLVLILLAIIAGTIFGIYIQLTNVDWNIEFISSVVGISLNGGYYIFMTYRYGATVGKMFFGLKVKNLEDEKLDIGTVIVREIVGKFVSVIFLGLGYLWIIFDRKKQGFHDKLAGTIVVMNKEQRFLKWKIATVVVLSAFVFFGFVIWLIYGVLEEEVRAKIKQDQIFLQVSRVSVAANLCVSEGNDIERPINNKTGGGDICSEEIKTIWPKLNDDYQYGRIDNEIIFIKKADLNSIRCEITKVKCELVD